MNCALWPWRKDEAWNVAFGLWSFMWRGVVLRRPVPWLPAPGAGPVCVCRGRPRRSRPHHSTTNRLNQGFSEAGGAVCDNNTRRAHGVDLVLGAALAAGDDGARMSHAPSGRGRASRDAARDRLFPACLRLVRDELGGFFLGRSADLADHDDRLGLRVAEQQIERVDMLGPLDRVTADADAG